MDGTTSAAVSGGAFSWLQRPEISPLKFAVGQVVVRWMFCRCFRSCRCYSPWCNSCYCFRFRSLLHSPFQQAEVGACSKKSAVVAECREPSSENFCPEGTRFGCSFAKREKLAVLVGTLSYAVSWGAMAYLVPGPQRESPYTAKCNNAGQAN